MQITFFFFLMSGKNIDFDHVCHTGNFLIRAHDSDVWINYFCPMRQFQSRSAIFFWKFIIFFGVTLVLTKIILKIICRMYILTILDVLHETLPQVFFILPTREYIISRINCSLNSLYKSRQVSRIIVCYTNHFIWTIFFVISLYYSNGIITASTVHISSFDQSVTRYGSAVTREEMNRGVTILVSSDISY